MNIDDPNQPPESPGRSIGDENVERLLAIAYQPERIDPEFAKRVRERALAASRERLRSTVTVPPHRFSSRSLAIGMAVAALAVLVAVGVFVFQRTRMLPALHSDDVVIWIHGRPYRPADLGSANDENRTPDPTQSVEQPVATAMPSDVSSSEDGLVARKRPSGTKRETAQVGAAISTKSGERRQFELPDGSVLYVNEGTKFNVVHRRRIHVDSGDVFVDVSPAETQGNEPFVVETPEREVTALGTKFAVHVQPAETRVAVTQGKVKFSGVDAPIDSGQQIQADETDGQPPLIGSSPRSSHLLAWARELFEQTDAPLVPKSDHAGGALVALDPNGQKAKLSLRNFHVDVHIEDGFARTTIDQTYFNHLASRVEGTFYFPLPADASISRLAMYVNGKLMEGGMAERDHAHQVFEAIKYRALDPALLEWIDGSTFKMRVFPLEGRQEKRIVLSYTQRLENHYGQTQYRFPAGHNLDAVRDWSTRIHFVNGQNTEWKCSSHTLKSSTRDGHLTLTASEHNAKLERDVVISFSEPRTAEIAADAPESDARFSMAEHEGANYLMLRLRPEIKLNQRRQRRDWIFLVETDGSREPLLARVQNDLVRKILEQADHQDTFSVIAAGAGLHALAPAQQVLSAESLAKAATFLDQSHLIGALDLERALVAAQGFAKTCQHPTLVHIGSGVPVLGEQRVEKLLAKIPIEVPYVGIGVGKRWNRTFMKVAASRSGGFFAQVNPDESTEWRALELVSSLNTPRLLDIEVKSDGPSDGGFLLVKDWVSHGEEICAVARSLTGKSAWKSVTVSGRLDGAPFQRVIPVTRPKAKADYLPRMWAKLTIDDLVAKDAAQHKSQIIELSKSMYVMSPFTSLLVLENDEMYAQYNVDRGRKDHWAMYPCPAQIEVVTEPLNGPQLAPSPSPLTRPSVEAILRTLPNFVNGFVPQPPQYGVRSGRGHFHWNYDLEYDANSNGRLDQQFWRFTTPSYDAPSNGFSSFWDVNQDSVGYFEPRFGNTASPRYRNGGAANADFDSLIDLIQATIAPDSWSESRYSMRTGAFPSNLSLIIRQTQSVHQVDALSDSNWNGVVDLGERWTPMFVPYVESMQASSWSESISGSHGVLPSHGWAWPVFPNRRTNTVRSPSPSTVGDLKGLPAMMARLTQRLTPGTPPPNLLYTEPPALKDHGADRPLIQFAPGFQTTADDVSAVIDAEAHLENRPKTGSIDDRARALIEKCRNRGWQSVSYRSKALSDRDSPSEDHVQLKVVVDGHGRFRYQRRTPLGLDEIVIGDGRTVRHLYPELGLGTVRSMSRFHRRSLQSLIPWYLPPVEELAIGADVRWIDANTVELVHHRREEGEGKDRTSPRRASIQLIFSGDGQLVEKRWFDVPGNEAIWRVRIEANGRIQVLNHEGESIGESQLQVEDAGVPELSPDVRQLVVIPMPVRSEDVIRQSALSSHADAVGQAEAKPGTALQSIADERQDSSSLDPTRWREDDVLRLIALDHWVNPATMKDWIIRRFFAKGDHRLGFYTLLVSSGEGQTQNGATKLLDESSVRWSHLDDHPTSPLARYLRARLLGESVDESVVRLRDEPANTFLENLVEYRRLFERLNRKAESPEQAVAVREALEPVFNFIDRGVAPQFSLALLMQIQQQYKRSQPHGRIAESLLKLEAKGTSSYIVKYELARSLIESGKPEQGRKLFVELYREAANDDFLPPIDSAFHAALTQGGPFSGPDASSPVGFSDLMRETAVRWINEQRVALVFDLAWQCRQLGETSLADELVSRVLENASQASGHDVTLLAIGYFAQSERSERADALLQPILADERFSQSPAAWRLASQNASNGRLFARSVRYLERALDREFATMPAQFDVQQLRDNYGVMFDRLHDLARSISVPGTEPPADLIRQTIRLADRWRSLDTDATSACQRAAEILSELGKDELAWEYLTTPLSLQPGEIAGWESLAVVMAKQESIRPWNDEWKRRLTLVKVRIEQLRVPPAPR